MKDTVPREIFQTPAGTGNFDEGHYQQIRHIWPNGTHTPANPTQLQKIRHAQSASLENQRHGTVPNIYIPLPSTPPPSRNRPRFLPLRYACETIPHGGKPAGKRPYSFVATPVKAGQLGQGSPEVRSTAPHVQYRPPSDERARAVSLSSVARWQGNGKVIVKGNIREWRGGEAVVREH
ncbi:hypothetical protein B0H11DRAFT_1919093 [Mycena galericulata]|nr:hypothetical protein B0H11DRAFT_1919093 [Mycena galericulata]